MVEVRNRMLEAGASYVIRNIEELPALIQTINLKMNTL
jgi:phosphonoacetaldehyde hydrolase